MMLMGICVDLFKIETYGCNKFHGRENVGFCINFILCGFFIYVNHFIHNAEILWMCVNQFDARSWFHPCDSLFYQKI